MKEYEYYISYAYVYRNANFDSCSITRVKKIKSIKDIEEINKDIKDNLYEKYEIVIKEEDIIILGIFLLEGE